MGRKHISRTKRTVEDPKSQVQSLAKGLRVLEAFRASEPELTLAEVARRAGLDNGTTFRMLNTLVALGYVQRESEARLFRLAHKVLDLGFNAIAHTDLRNVARPILRNLVGKTNELAAVSVLEGGEVVYIERVQAGMVRLGVDIRVGSRIPAYVVSTGRAMLAYLPLDEQRRILNSHQRMKLTPDTVTDLRDLQEILASTRRQGYAVADGETAPGLRALAAPVLDVDMKPIAAVSVVAPAMRHPLDEFIALSAKPVLAAAAELGRMMQAGGAIALSV